MNMQDLQDFKLTDAEWHALAAFDLVARGEIDRCAPQNHQHVDVLVLAGLVEKTGESVALTSDGAVAAGEIDGIFDWDEFVYVEGSGSPCDASDEPKQPDTLADALARPERLTVGSLVRHIPTGGIGLITEHTMYDANWGGFYVDFVKPVDNIIGGRVTNQLRRMFDRGDKFERMA